MNSMAHKFAGNLDDVENRMLADFVLEAHGEYFPSLEKMKETIAVPETSDTIRERLTEINKEHAEFLDKLYDWQANQCHEEAFDIYTSLDETVPMSSAMKKRLSSPPPSTFNSHAYETIRYSHLQTVLHLQARLALIKSQEAAEQRRIDSQFPLSISDYHLIRDKQVQLRIAKFLMLEDETPGNSALIRSRRDQVMSQFGWAWMQVTRLCEEYAKNEDFKAEVQTIVREVKAAGDPRRKRP